MIGRMNVETEVIEAQVKRTKGGESDEQDNTSFDDSEASSMQRFVRVLYGTTVLEPSSVLGAKVPWLSRLQVYSSACAKLSAHPDFIMGNVIGMDAASALTVEALDPQPGLHILDLCCAPGVKLAAIAELMGKRGFLAGVDISEPRLNTTASLLRKYNICMNSSDIDKDDWNVVIFQQDGRQFDPVNNKGSIRWSTEMNSIFVGGKPLSMPRKRAGKGLRKILARQATEELERMYPTLFDRVLVDAECTTDGRGHVKSGEELTYKKHQWSGENGAPSEEEQRATENLQFELLLNGYRLLKPGGMLVYSTCSMMEGQNEHVIGRFLKQHPEAQLLSPCGHLTSDADNKIPPFVQPSKTLGVLGWRLNPQASGTSGMFFSRLTKPMS